MFINHLLNLFLLLYLLNLFLLLHLLNLLKNSLINFLKYILELYKHLLYKHSTFEMKINIYIKN